MQLITTGVTRIILLVGPYAIKIPNIKSWRLLLHGLLANMQERLWSPYSRTLTAPVLFSMPGGFLLVMERCTPVESLSNRQVKEYKRRCARCGLLVPVEFKASSFGIHPTHGLVALDYGT